MEINELVLVYKFNHTSNFMTPTYGVIKTICFLSADNIAYDITTLGLSLDGELCLGDLAGTYYTSESIKSVKELSGWLLDYKERFNKIEDKYFYIDLEYVLVSTQYKGKTIKEATKEDDDFLKLLNLLNNPSLLDPLDKTHLELFFTTSECVSRQNLLCTMQDSSK